MARGENVSVDQSRLASFELFTTDDLSACVEIWPCRHCASWHLDARPYEGGRVVIREWHDQDCAHLRSLLEGDIADANKQ